jgi:uncharacterized HAD superfamily protein
MDAKYIATRAVAFFIFLSSGVFYCGCKSPTADNPYPYTADDFSGEVRDVLRKIEQYNVVYIRKSGCRGSGEYVGKAQQLYNDLEKKSTNKELQKATKCSNPAIRAYAIELLLEDSATNIAALAYEHLFDSAIIFDDYANRKWTITSLLLHHTDQWKNEKERTKFEKELLEKRPFEIASYDLVNPDINSDTFPGFYSILRSMVSNYIYNDSDGLIEWHYAIQAVDRLSTYKYQQDITLLDSAFESSLDFANGYFYPATAIKNFPAPEFEKYYLDTSNSWRRQFRFLRLNTLSYYDNNMGIHDFVDLIIEHKSAKSARMIEMILEHSPFNNWGVGGVQNILKRTESINSQIAEGIRANPSPHYDRLLKMTEKYIDDVQVLME